MDFTEFFRHNNKLFGLVETTLDVVVCSGTIHHHQLICLQYHQLGREKQNILGEMSVTICCKLSWRYIIIASYTCNALCVQAQILRKYFKALGKDQNCNLMHMLDWEHIWGSDLHEHQPTVCHVSRPNLYTHYISIQNDY